MKVWVKFVVWLGIMVVWMNSVGDYGYGMRPPGLGRSFWVVLVDIISGLLNFPTP